ncbi:MAG: LysR family transcriptional regulator [Candidatus Tectomicrobia bacterium]|nr:LysR family transcriptional regulator [Candidatus Tectomicrobia bacterium]
MDLLNFKIFCDVVETRSFTKAAARNYLSQSAVSQQVRSIEEELNETLINRGRGTLELTEAGEIFLVGSRSILQSFEEIKARLAATKREVSGAIRISSTYSIGLYELPPYLQRFIQLYPNVQMSVDYRHTPDIYEDVISKRVDLGFVAYPSPRPQLTIHPFREDRLTLVCHPDHPFSKLSSIDPRQLHEQPFVAFSRVTPTSKAIRRILKRAHAQVRIVMEFDNIELIKRAVEINGGVSIVPWHTILPQVQNGVLAAVPLRNANDLRPLGVLLRKERILPTAVLRFLDLLEEPLDIANHMKASKSAGR